MILQTLAAKINAGDVGIPKGGANSVLSNGLDLVYFAAGFAAVIVIILGGIKYAISSGDAGEIKSAKETILYAIVGLVVVLMAFVITGFITGKF